MGQHSSGTAPSRTSITLGWQQMHCWNHHCAQRHGIPFCWHVCYSGADSKGPQTFVGPSQGTLGAGASAAARRERSLPAALPVPVARLHAPDRQSQHVGSAGFCRAAAQDRKAVVLMAAMGLGARLGAPWGERKRLCPGGGPCAEPVPGAVGQLPANPASAAPSYGEASSSRSLPCSHSLRGKPSPWQCPSQRWHRQSQHQH